MPSVRASGQRLINLPASEELIAKMDDNLKGLGYSDRSKFIRDAIAEKLRSMKVPVEPEIVLAPGRAGKGGKPTHRKKQEIPIVYPAQTESPVSMNDATKKEDKNR